MFNKLIEKSVLHTKLIEIDFSKAWWRIFWSQRALGAIVLLYNIVDIASYSVLPIIIGYMLSMQNIFLVVPIISYYIFVEIVGWVLYHPAVNRLSAQTHDSFRYSAYKHLLGVDPLHHIHRASGTVIGKIQRTSAAYSDFIHTLLDDVVQFLVEMITVIVSAFLFDRYLGICIAMLIMALTIPFTYYMLRKTGPIEEESNKADDKVNQLGAESLTQVQFIRATFMSSRIRAILLTNITWVMHVTMRLWLTYALIRGLFIVLYLVSLAGVLMVMISLIQQGNLTPLYATTIVAMYLRATRKMFRLDTVVKTLLTSYRRIKDFYNFVHSFGGQSFPVFKDDSQSTLTAINDPGVTHIYCPAVSFAYSAKRVVFKDISFELNVSLSENNKLYGIIGPSGVGKTTFISLLGGQLKPQSGYVYINGTDIYELDDDGRKKLIALQGQIATNVRGTLRYNLLFGLPEKRHYNDLDLVAILRSVGLWNIFEYEHGLETRIGEGGLSLSGGQRQRLNFANLYLRAHYYKPAIILIDEPTSSLDELSEAAITQMIVKLSQRCVTMVIAHRLKTLEDAYKIIDFSLLERDKKLILYTTSQLLAESEYYQQLVEGKRNLEE